MGEKSFKAVRLLVTIAVYGDLRTHLASIYKRPDHVVCSKYASQTQAVVRKKEQVLSLTDRQEFHDFLDQPHHDTSFLLADE